MRTHQALEIWVHRVQPPPGIAGLRLAGRLHKVAPSKPRSSQWH